MSISVRRVALAKKVWDGASSKKFSKWNDGRVEAELNLKFYRQATNKIIGISNEAAEFLRGILLTWPIRREYDMA